MKKILLPLIAASTVMIAHAVPTTVTWNGLGGSIGTDTGSISDFNDGTLNLLGSSFFADQLIDISGPGYHHSHGAAAVTFKLDVMVDGVWVNLFTQLQNPGTQTILGNLATPVSFAGGVVSQIRLTSDPNQNQSFHSMFNTTFTFDAIATPEFSSTLILLGLASVGLGCFRRKS